MIFSQELHDDIRSAWVNRPSQLRKRGGRRRTPSISASVEGRFVRINVMSEMTMTMTGVPIGEVIRFLDECVDTADCDYVDALAVVADTGFAPAPIMLPGLVSHYGRLLNRNRGQFDETVKSRFRSWAREQGVDDGE
jgi:hypothetical protein